MKYYCLKNQNEKAIEHCEYWYSDYYTDRNAYPTLESDDSCGKMPWSVEECYAYCRKPKARQADGDSWKCVDCPAGYAMESGTCTICPSGKYSDAAGSETCSDCRTCGSNEYVSSACVYNSNTVCTPCPTCPSGQYDSNFCSQETANCVRCRQACGTNQYESQPCATNQNRVCSACSTGACPSGQYESTACSATEDRKCSDCATCASDEYEQKTCSGSDDSECAPCNACPSGKYEDGGCDGVSDNVCRDCDTCVLGTSFRVTGSSCTKATTTCSPCTQCNNDQYEHLGCTLARDRECRSCGEACGHMEYEHESCTATAPRVCKDCPQCADGFWRRSCDVKSGALDCVECTSPNLPAGYSCEQGQTWGDCGGDSRGRCVGCRSCDEGKQVTGCTDQLAGTCIDCAAGKFRSGTGKGACQDVTICSADEYDASEWTLSDLARTEDSDCKALSVCAAGTYDPFRGTSAAGTHREADAECVSCTAFYSWPSADGVFWVTDSSASVCEFLCLPGYEMFEDGSGAKCRPCRKGYAKDITSDDACSQCPSGS